MLTDDIFLQVLFFLLHTLLASNKMLRTTCARMLTDDIFLQVLFFLLHILYCSAFGILVYFRGTGYGIYMSPSFMFLLSNCVATDHDSV